MQQVIAILGDDNSDGSIKVEVMGEENLDLFPITARDELEQSFRIEKFEIESEDTSHTITLPDGINADDLLGAATVNQIKTKHDAKVVWPISFSTFFNHANILGAIHKRRLLGGGGRGSPLKANLLHKPI